jgi:hypothetical protein
VSQPCLIALDWGTSNLRASLLDRDGSVLDTRSAAAGVMAVPERRFAEALLSLCGDWLAAHPHTACIASGMVGSRQGWIEAPYLECPRACLDAAARLVRVTFGAEHACTSCLGCVVGRRWPGRRDAGRRDATMGCRSARRQLLRAAGHAQQVGGWATAIVCSDSRRT